ncbi:MAG: hypothetical protein WCE62_10755 [Polyangiales bacterium]
MQRTAIGLLALMFVLTTGMSGGVLHLCGMQGLVQRTCCCHEADEGPSAQLKSVDDCCGALISKGQHPPAAAGSDKGGVDAPMPFILAGTTDESCGEGPQTAGWIARPRASPREHGPPLFVWNCSYLI